MLSRKTRRLVWAPVLVLGVAIALVPQASRDVAPDFKCSNGGLVVIASENQRARDIAVKYCTGDIDAAEQALIDRYRSDVIPHWAFVNVESLGK